MTRFAETRPVLFIEEPVKESPSPSWDCRDIALNLTVCRPRTPVEAGGFSDPQFPHLRTLVRDLLRHHAPDGYDLWFYTPMAFPLAEGLTPRTLVYDCMDQLSAFKFAPPELIERERQLLARADVVFTGGPSLYKAKKDHHANCYCFPSSVDAAHFGRAAQPGLAEPEPQAAIPHPRLGFFGVIDERFDRDLLATAAEMRPEWQFVMVGPIVKIAPDELPRRSNVHYLGQQRYDDLPAFLAGWDVALLPFARNESTKYISPTKTLEYMAAGKPIVSTPITDVAEPYGSIVGLGSTAEEFVLACEQRLSETKDEKAKRCRQYRDVLSKTSWDSTAAAMSEFVDRAEGKGKPYQTTPAETPGFTTSAPVVVIGAGPTGLSAAYHLGDDSLLLESNAVVGGWCQSLVDNGFTFDFAGHIMFSNDPYVHEMYSLLLGENVHWQDREAWIYSKNVALLNPSAVESL